MAATQVPIPQPYMTSLILREYVRDTFNCANPLQASIDTICQKILDNYFKLSYEFISETQAYPDQTRDRSKSNVVVTTLDNGKLKKVLILEAKRFPQRRSATWFENLNAKSWTNPKEQLWDYMAKARNRDRWNHAMYGIVVVGDRLRFFQLAHGSVVLVDYLSPNLTPAQQQRSPFHIVDDSLLIHTVLLGLEIEFRTNRR